METKRRSLAKSLSWRVFATVITIIVAFVITRKVDFALEIGLLDTTLKFVTYFAHERLWARVGYGRPEPVSSTGEDSEPATDREGSGRA